MLLWSTHSRKFIFILFEESLLSFLSLFKNKLHHFSLTQFSNCFSRSLKLCNLPQLLQRNMIFNNYFLLWKLYLKKTLDPKLKLNWIEIKNGQNLLSFYFSMKSYEKIFRHCIKPLISMLNIFYAHKYYWGKSCFT